MNVSQHNYLATSLDYQVCQAERPVDIILLCLRRDAHRAAACQHLVGEARDGAGAVELRAKRRFGDRPFGELR